MLCLMPLIWGALPLYVSGTPWRPVSAQSPRAAWPMAGCAASCPSPAPAHSPLPQVREQRISGCAERYMGDGACMPRSRALPLCCACKQGKHRPRTHSPGKVTLEVETSATRIECLGMVPVCRNHSTEVCHGCIDAAQLLMRGAPLEQRIQVVWLQGDDPSIVPQRRMVLACTYDSCESAKLVPRMDHWLPGREVYIKMELTCRTSLILWHSAV